MLGIRIIRVLDVLTPSIIPLSIDEVVLVKEILYVMTIELEAEGNECG